VLIPQGPAARWPA